MQDFFCFRLISNQHYVLVLPSQSIKYIRIHCQKPRKVAHSETGELLGLQASTALHLIFAHPTQPTVIHPKAQMPLPFLLCFLSSSVMVHLLFPLTSSWGPASSMVRKLFFVPDSPILLNFLCGVAAAPTWRLLNPTREFQPPPGERPPLGKGTLDPLSHVSPRQPNESTRSMPPL